MKNGYKKYTPKIQPVVYSRFNFSLIFFYSISTWSFFFFFFLCVLQLNLAASICFSVNHFLSIFYKYHWKCPIYQPIQIPPLLIIKLQSGPWSLEKAEKISVSFHYFSSHYLYYFERLLTFQHKSHSVTLISLFLLLIFIVFLNLKIIVYTPEGARVVAGAVVVNYETRQILLICSSTNPNKFIIPKGGVELDEQSDYRIAAVRETWEEAGVYATSIDKLGPELGERPIVNMLPMFMRPKHPYPNCPKNEFHFYELDIKHAKLENDWPEAKWRTRIWVSPEEAIEKLKSCNRPELVEAVQRCSLFKN